MITPLRHSVIALLSTSIYMCAAGAAPPKVVPLLNAHAHNDYEHTRPLFDALDHGFTSVEADVFPVDGTLLVAHERRSLDPKRTLETMYLAPLAEQVEKNGGHVYPTASRFILLIDIKSDPPQTYRLLQVLFAKYHKMFTGFTNGKVTPGPITAVLTGNRPKLDLDDPAPRYAGLDGRVSDVSSSAPSHFMPMISDAWPMQFHWNGSGPMPADERAKLQGIVSKAHASGRVVRFWATPENEDLWRELRSDGVDLINTDQLDRLAKFLTATETPQQP